MKIHGQYEYSQEFAKRLAEQFTSVGSDKATSHGYEEIYSHLLAERKPNSFLELGLFLHDTQDTDLFAWEQVFPDANIYGADIKKHLLFERGNIKTFFIDQSSRETLQELKDSIGENVDIILDDASHVFELSINTFEEMFEIVSDGGVYLIEDMLFENYNMDSGEQRVSQFVEYFDKTGFKYEVYATSKVHQCVDSVVVAIFK